LGKPIIYVALNYRLGYYGWLASQELRDEALRNGEAGFANQGLHDQRLGLKWVSIAQQPSLNMAVLSSAFFDLWWLFPRLVCFELTDHTRN
jgi:hypothetical protein